MKKTNIISRAGRGWLAAFIGVLGIIGGARQQSWANDIAYRDVVRGTDFKSAGVGGLRNVGRGTITLRGMTGVVSRAWLYWAGPANTASTLANADLMVNGRPVHGDTIGLTSDNCWGFANSQAYRADVTDIVTARRNGAYVLSGLVKQGTNINVNGASLLVFYDDGNPKNDRDIVYFDGNDSNAPNPYDLLGWNVGLSQIRYTNGLASLQLHVSDGQSYKDGELIVNGTTLAPAGSVFPGTSVPSANAGPIGNGSLWDIRSFDVTSFLMRSPESLRLTHRWINPGGDCVSLIVGVINLPAGAAPVEPLLTNRPPTISADGEMTIDHSNQIVLTAIATDPDGDKLTTAISVDGTLMETGEIPKGTPVTSGTISLTHSFGLGEHQIVFAAADSSEGVSCITVLRVIDNMPPVLCLPHNITRPTDPGRSNAVVIFTATATDNFDSNVTVICIPPSGNAFPIGVTMVNCSATDRAGNPANGSFTIAVTDTLPPVIDCLTDIVRPPDRSTNASAVVFTVDFSDNEPGATLVCTPPSGAMFPVGTTRVVCVARDRAGNTASCSFNVTIQTSARLMKQQELAYLKRLIPTITDYRQRKKVQEACDHLARSLTPAWWVDDLHLDKRTGEKVFHEEKYAVVKLNDAICYGLSSSLVQGTIDSMVAADRALAATAIDEGRTPSCKKDYLAKARSHFAAGDAQAAANAPERAIYEYQKAWKYAMSAN